MPRKFKRRKEEETKEPVWPTENQVLGVVEQFLGYDRARVKCADGVTRLCRIPGKMKKRVWLKIGDIVLVAPWDFQPSKGDILHRYSTDELKQLAKRGYLKGLEDYLPPGILPKTSEEKEESMEI